MNELTKEGYKLIAQLTYRRSHGVHLTEEEFGNLFDAIVTTVEEGALVLNDGAKESECND